MPRPVLKTYRLKADDIDFTVIRKRVRNTTIRIKNGEVVVTAPASQGDEKTCSVVRKHRDWIMRYVAKAEESRGKVMLFGKAYERKDEYAPRAFVRFSGSECVVGGKDEKDREKAILEYYKKAIAPVLAPLFGKWQKETGLYASKTSVTSARSYLGRCEVATKAIKISCRLAAKPVEVADYVVLHELCHLRVTGHQKDFYALVGKYLPDYKNRIGIMRGRRRMT